MEPAPRDVANITHWCGEQIESDLNWQIVNLQVPVTELHDAPILYISGDESLRLNDAEIHKLKDFVEGGGMIVGNPDCDKPAFGESFEKLGSKMFKYEFRDLPPTTRSLHTRAVLRQELEEQADRPRPQQRHARADAADA